jgi:large subunit ribosomal protein L5
MSFNLKKEYKEKIAIALKEKYSLGAMSIPRLEKIVINRGLGEAVTNSKVVDYTADQLKALTGQKAVLTVAKKSISNFKIRDGQVIGCKVTLREDKMYDFLTKLLKVGLPKIRDFRGVPKNSFDGRGNYTLGIKDDTVFPEVVFDKVDRIRGFDVTFVTSTDNDKQAYDLLDMLGMPFRKN